MNEKIKAIAIRTIKTMAEVAASMFTIGMTVKEIDWMHILSVTIVAGVYTILINIASVSTPEATMDGTLTVVDEEDKTQWKLNIETDPEKIYKSNSIRLKVDNQLHS